MDESEQLQRAIAALEAQRAALGDDVVDAALAPMRDKLAALQSQTAAEQRKLVTILFADLAGFTAMSERMDPEDVREVMNAYFKCWTTVVDQFGGELEKFIGDAVMAVFGLSTAREDDPQRAIRAALAMRPLLDDLNAQLQTERGIHLTVRVGIHTGPVVVSLLDERRATDFVVVGDSVNLASRLQSAAPTGAIMISHDTYRHVRGLFDVQVLEPIHVKGKQEPIQVYLVERAAPQRFHLGARGVEGVQTRMIGRDTELQRLQQALLTSTGNGERQFITVLGDPGIGKSRLLYEFDNWLQEQPHPVRVFKARSDPAMLYTAYSLLHSFFTLHFNIHDSDEAAIVRTKLEESVRAVFAAAPAALTAASLGANTIEEDEMLRAAHFVGHLAGFHFGPSPYLQEGGGNLQAFQAQALRYLQLIFRALLADRPAVLLLEDLHWADDSSLDALAALIEGLHDAPLLAVATARLSLLTRRPHWGEAQPFHKRLKLEPLSISQSRILLAEILQQVPDLPPTLQKRITGQAEGNPFFVEELVKMLIEDSVIITDRPPWRVDEARLATLRVPPTLTGVLQARLARLAPHERTVLQRSAVVGRTFWDQAVAYLAHNDATSDTTAALDFLRRRELIFRRRHSTFDATHEYRFKHALLRDVAYDTLLKRQRRRYHRRTAEWLVAVANQGNRAAEMAALIASHYEQAAAPAAAEWYWRAGQVAADRYANGEALHAFDSALALLSPANESLRFEILLAREKVYGLLGHQEARVRDLQALDKLARDNAAWRNQAVVALRHASYHVATSDFDPAIDHARRAITLVKETDEGADIIAEACLLQANALTRQGAFDLAREQAMRSLHLARHHDWPVLQANSLRALGLINYYLGSAREAHDHFEQARVLFARAGDRQGEAHALSNLGAALFNLGDYAAAQSFYGRSLQLCRKIGDRLGEARALNNLGITAVNAGRFDEAESYYLQCLAICHQIGHRSFEASVLDNLGNLAMYRYQYARAQDHFHEAAHVARAINDTVTGNIVMLNLGRAYLATGDYETAYEHLQESLALNQGAHHGSCHARLALSQYYLELDDVVEARRQAHDALQEAQTFHLRSEEAAAHHYHGAALLAAALAGDAGQAAAAYQTARDLRRELGETTEEIESIAGLAAVALAAGHPGDALAHVEEILAALHVRGLLGFEQPALVLLTCYRVLRANHDPRAADILQQGHDLLQTCAASLPSPAHRDAFFTRVPAHRELIAAWSQRS